jgi:CubicO group peptidase (beta-lactamase class C family)
VSVPSGAAYDGVTIKKVLQISSGVRWDDTYTDRGSEVFRLGVTQMPRQLLVAATGRSISDYMREKLMQPLGMNAAGCWLIDSTGSEMAFAGVNLISRDFAKLGKLYRLGGIWNGRQVFPADWVQAPVTSDVRHLQPGSIHSVPFGYAYQWWVPAGERGEFLAAGVYNQFVYVDPSREVVIVKLSASRRYGTTMTEATNRQVESVALFRAIAASLD